MRSRKPPAPLDEDGLYQKAVAALARRSRSEAEVRRLLLRRAIPGEEGVADVHAVVNRLRDHGYLDDRKFAGHYALWQKEGEAHGRARVRRELKARGVANEIAEAAIEEHFGESDEEELIRTFLRRRRIQPPETPRQAANLFRKLLLAGFSPDTSIHCLKQWKVNPEWVEQLSNIEVDEEP